LLPKLGWLRYRNSREVLGQVRNVTVSQSGGKWFISIQTQRELEQPLPTSTLAIGIDVGIARFATLSDGNYVAPLNSFKTHQQRLARYQRRMSRKEKFSNNWKKAKAKVQKIHIAAYKPNLSGLRPCIKRQSTDSGEIPVHCL
jgi:putative transposase